MVVAHPTGTQHCARRHRGLSPSLTPRTRWVTWHQFPACGWGDSGALEGFGVFESTANGELFLCGAQKGRGR
jgi:hypothetical protein